MGARSDRTSFQRKPQRGSHDRELIDSILDAGMVAHLGLVDAEGRPFVIPTLQARVGDRVYLHGSAASRALRALATGAPACLTVTLLDGVVLAGAAFRHSVNYRSAVLYGEATAVVDEAQKLEALRAFVERLVPGRWADARPPTPSELRATAVLTMPIEEASAKFRSGPPVADEEDADGVWTGIVPTRIAALPPQAAAASAAVEPPPYLQRWVDARA